MEYFLKTNRIGFANWNEDDLPLAIKLWGDPDVTRLFDGRGKLTDAQVAERLRAELEVQKKYNIQYWPIFLLEGNEFIGCCGLKPSRKKEENVLELGIHLCPQYHKKGYAFEAGVAAINYAFDVLKATALVAGHHPENYSSQTLISKLGFEPTGEELYPPTGLLHPMYRLEGHG